MVEERQTTASMWRSKPTLSFSSNVISLNVETQQVDSSTINVHSLWCWIKNKHNKPRIQRTNFNNVWFRKFCACCVLCRPTNQPNPIQNNPLKMALHSPHTITRSPSGHKAQQYTMYGNIHLHTTRHTRKRRWKTRRTHLGDGFAMSLSMYMRATECVCVRGVLKQMAEERTQLFWASRFPSNSKIYDRRPSLLGRYGFYASVETCFIDTISLVCFCMCASACVCVPAVSRTIETHIKHDPAGRTKRHKTQPKRLRRHSNCVFIFIYR